MADQPAVRALVDAACAADARDYALKSNALVAEWYPKINQELYGAEHKPSYGDILLIFEPDLKVPAFASRNQIHASCSYIPVMKDDYRAMLIHELSHVVQAYPPAPSGTGWIVEGIADYVRHKYFEKDIKVTLRMNEDGRLYGYGETEPYFHSIQDNRIDLTVNGYQQSYTVASSFLFWLESKKNPKIVQELNLAFSQGTYSPELFRQICGKPLDELWAEFVAASKA